MSGKSEPRAPVAFGPYLITRRIARGGMAEIFRAWTPARGWLALKLMRSALGHEVLRAQLFEREARITTLLDHPNVVPVHAYGEELGRPYLAMEYVRGCDLAHLLKNDRRGRPPPSAALALWFGMHAARGLGHAHRQQDGYGRPLGIVHRDVSPGNVMVGYDGSVKVLDFGVARINEATSNLQTQTGVLRGKFAYMSPEQTRGENIDARSDVFSLGTVLYELITGKNCFRAKEPLGTLERVQSLRPAPPSKVQRGIPRVVDEVLARCLAKEPDRRFADGVEVAAAIGSLLDQLGAPVDESVAARHMEGLFGARRRAEEADLAVEIEEVEGAAKAEDFDPRAAPPSLDAGEVKVSTHEEASRDQLERLARRPSAPHQAVFASGFYQAAEAEVESPVMLALSEDEKTETFPANQAMRDTDPEHPPTMEKRTALLRSQDPELAPAPAAPAVSSRARWVLAMASVLLVTTFAVLSEPMWGPWAKGETRRGPTKIPPVTIEVSVAGPDEKEPPPPYRAVRATEPTPRPDAGPVQGRSRRPASGSGEAKADRARSKSAPPASAKGSRRRPSKRRRSQPAARRKTGFLNVGARPWARITIDGQPWPHATPQAGIELEAGVHTVELSNPETGRKVVREVKITAGGYRTIQVDLRPR